VERKLNMAKVIAGMLVENLYQEMEVWVPIYRLQEIGVEVKIIAPTTNLYKSKLGYPANPDMSAKEALANSFDLIITPGGYAPDLLRVDSDVIKLIKKNYSNGALIAAICHGTWVLISAQLISGVKVTGASQIKDDIENAGGIYSDSPVVIDKNIITSRKPSDIPYFCKAIVDTLEKKAK
jgi:protease I